MNALRLVVAVLTTALLVACGTEDGDDTASDPAPDPSAVASLDPVPGTVPAATGAVSTAHVALVMDRDRPELCLGPVMESWPPQCSGLPLAGWRWSEHPEHETQDGLRWGSFAVTGTWDGEVFTVKSAIPAALYDAPADDPMTQPTAPTPSASLSAPLSAQELSGIVEESSVLPGRLSAAVVGEQVLVDVIYDDGSLQEWAEATWGPGVVVLLPLLRGEGAS